MKVFNCILGVFSILGSIYCIFFPGRTFLDGGWVVTMLLGAIGFCCIFEYFSNRNKKDKKEHKFLMVNGVFGLVIGIISAITSLLATFSILARFMLDIVILLLFVVWLLYSGVNSIIQAVHFKKTGSKWIFTLILGVLVILTGLYSIFHLIFTAITIGYLIGFALMIYGIRLIASVFEPQT